jgi:hypothetical protein
VHRAYRKAAKVEFAQEFSNAALVQIDPEPAGDAIAQVNPTKPHYTILGKIGALFHPSFDLRLFGRAQTRGAPAAGAVGEAADASLVIAMNPIAKRLPVHPAGLRRLMPAMAIQNHGDRKNT